MKRTTAAAAFITVLLWGSAYPGIRAGLDAFAPGPLALLRYLFASTTMVAVMGARAAMGRPFQRPRLRDLPALALLGALGFTIYHAALNIGQVTVTAGAASFLVETAPVFATLMAAIFLGERLTGLGWAGLMVSLGGAALIALGESGGAAAGGQLGTGALWVLAAAVSGAGYFTLQKPYLQRYAPLELTAYALWAGTLGLAFWAPALPAQVAAAPLSTTLAVAYLGIFPGALGYVTYAFVLKRLPVAQTTSLLYLVPLATLPIAWAWLGEVPHTSALVGGAVTLLGVVLVHRSRRTSTDAATQTNDRRARHRG